MHLRSPGMLWFSFLKPVLTGTLIEILLLVEFILEFQNKYSVGIVGKAYERFYFFSRKILLNHPLRHSNW